MKTSVVINGMPTVIKAFVEARIRIQNDLDELETYTGKKNPRCCSTKDKYRTVQCNGCNNIRLGEPSKHLS